MDLQAGRITVARALLVELQAASAGWLFERAFLLCFSAILTPSRWLATVYCEDVSIVPTRQVYLSYNSYPY